MNVLCICPIGIGNYLMCYPAFSVLKKRFPDVSLHLLALRHGIAALAKSDSLWSSIDVFDPDKMKSDLTKAVSALARIRGKHIDASINFFPSNTWHYHALPFLCGIPKRYAFRYEKKRLPTLSFLATHHKAVNPLLHDVQQNLAMSAFFLGEDIQKETVVFPTQYTDDDKKWAQAFCAEKAIDKRYIAIHPGSSVEHGMNVKRWDPKRFAALADKACSLLCATAFVVGSADENDIKQQTAQAMKENVCVVDPVSLGQTTALLAQCDVAICNDSGIMHMAACMGVPTVGIFGPTDETRNGPYSQKSLVIRKPLQGFPLWTARNVGDRSLPQGLDPAASLAALTSDDAWDKLLPWLEKNVLQQ